MDTETRERAFRLVATLSIGISLLAVTVTLVAFPLTFQYVQYLQRQLNKDVKFCQVTFHVFYYRFRRDAPTRASLPLAE